MKNCLLSSKLLRKKELRYSYFIFWKQVSLILLSSVRLFYDICILQILYTWNDYVQIISEVCLTDMKIKIRGSFAVSSATDFIQLNTKQNIYYVSMYLFTIF